MTIEFFKVRAWPICLEILPATRLRLGTGVSISRHVSKRRLILVRETFPRVWCSLARTSEPEVVPGQA